MTLTTDREARPMVALNADVVGYSRLMADDFSATAAAMDEYHRLVEEKVSASRGTLVVFVGDSFMAVFDQAIDALEAAIAIHTAIEARNLDLPPHRQVRFRMGIDQGEVTISADRQYFGDALNIAARLQAQAPPGGISVSGNVYQALDEPELRFRSTGHQRLKNIPGSVPVYEFLDLPADGSAASRVRLLSMAPPTVTILPIHTETVEESVRRAGSLLLADLVHRLSSIPNLTVIDATDDSRTQQPAPTAQYMLETGVHQYGETVRVYTKLVDFAAFNLVFSHRFDTSKDNLLSLSDHIGEEVTRSLQVELIVGEPARIYSDLGNPAAQEDIYRGWFQLTALTREGWERAIEYFERVAKSFPDNAVGHALLAFTHWFGAAERIADDPGSHFQLAARHARRGIEVGDPTGMSQMVEAANLASERDFEQALQRLEEVQITRPTCDVTYALEGSVRRYLGQWEKSVELLDRAMRLTQVINPWYPTIQACSLYIGHRLEGAASTAEAVLEHQPHNLEALLILAASQHEMGLDRRARATAELVKERYPAMDVDAWLAAHPYQSPLLVERWRQTLQELGLIT